MSKRFNVTGLCEADKHYMVDMSNRLEEIQQKIKEGAYLTVNRGRQYGKTTLLSLLKKRLEREYTVFFISFEGIGEEAFADSDSISRTFCGLLYDTIDYGEVKDVPGEVTALLREKSEDREQKIQLRELSNVISKVCNMIDKPVVLMIDEVDQAGNYKSFIDFLGVLREKYLKRDTRDTFQSVILAGVYDIKNLKLKIRSDEEHQYNSPWNIAVNADVNMSFQIHDIAGMLVEYEKDYATGMDVLKIAEMLYDYTSGYPFLVSRLCQIMDEQLPKQPNFADKKQAWSRDGVLEAVKLLLSEPNTLFDDMRKKLADFPELRNMLYEMLYNGTKYAFNVDDFAIDIAKMFCFVKDNHGTVAVANRIFETRLYNLFVSEETKESTIYSAGSMDKNQFVENGHLDMKKILERFVVHFTDLYGDNDDVFLEKVGRKYFLFYLKPIINGTGNYYVEAETRDEGRTDVVVDYHGEQFVVEMKIWRGDAYNQRGEKQLLNYLDAYHLQKGYMLSFNFNKGKKVGVKEIKIGEKVLVEAVV